MDEQKRALTIMLQELGENYILDAIFRGYMPPFDAVPATTWTELVDQGQVYKMPGGGPALYQLTGPGWLAALEINGGIDDVFRSKLGGLMAALKERIRGRDADGCADVFQVADTIQCPVGWICNVIQSRAVQVVLKRKGPRWYSGNPKSHVIDIPNSLGAASLL